MDYFTFKDDFEDYTQMKAMSVDEQLRILKKKCLTGRAKATCQQFELPGKIFEQLRLMFGNPVVFFQQKKKALLSISACEGAPVKQRDWLLTLQSKLTSLHLLAAKHDMVDEFLHSGIIGDIYDLLPKEFCKELSKGITGHGSVYVSPQDRLDGLWKWIPEEVDRINSDHISNNFLKIIFHACSEEKN